jgi:peptidoglycan/xylan/chitin deacetylase (PgdA/CDA1 family)
MNNFLTGVFIAVFMLTSCGLSSKEGRNAPPDPDDEKKEVVFLVYHRFGDSRYPSTNTDLDIFKQQLKYLKDASFKVLTAGEAITYLYSREMPYYPKVVSITVDDGYKSFLTGAVPLLKAFGYQATLFVNTESVGGGSYMNWEELKKLVKEGIEIGNHSHAHPYFLNISAEHRRERFEEDLEISRKLFKKHLGLDPDLYVYPYGEFDREMQTVLKSAGFRAAFAQNSGVVYRGSDRYALPRFPVAGVYGRPDRFKEKTRMKALRIAWTRPDDHVVSGPANPALLLAIDKKQDVSLNELQCFIGGSVSKIRINKTDSVDVIEVKSKEPFHSRRTLYTLTAPSKDHKQWYWYSFPWFCPSCE